MPFLLKVSVSLVLTVFKHPDPSVIPLLCE